MKTKHVWLPLEKSKHTRKSLQSETRVRRALLTRVCNLKVCFFFLGIVLGLMHTVSGCKILGVFLCLGCHVQPAIQENGCLGNMSCSHTQVNVKRSFGIYKSMADCIWLPGCWKTHGILHPAYIQVLAVSRQETLKSNKH